MSQELKDLKIKTNTVKLLLGDLKMSDKEIAQQKARIEKVKADAEKDDHDTRAQVHAPPRRRAALLAHAAQRACPREIAQEAVLAEMVGGRASEVDLLKQRGEELDIYMVRGDHARGRSPTARARSSTPRAPADVEEGRAERDRRVGRWSRETQGGVRDARGEWPPGRGVRRVLN